MGSIFLKALIIVDKKKLGRIVIGGAAILVLLIFFIRQRFDFAGLLIDTDNQLTRFLINRTIRFFINDMFAILLIYALFAERKYVVFALWVQLLGIIFLLIPYFILKINFPSYNGPLINFLHRIILNPTLIILLIPAFYYQQRLKRPADRDVED
ncbi:MAG: exosortase F system-associated protein [Cyclobacteriaceae bacterium]|nr:exosortase F system-associated protein [Cyclobacteriaceae bacterium]